MKDIPGTIFLQIDEYGKDAESFKELETTYCEDKIYEDDIEYILKSKYEELKQQKAELINILKSIAKMKENDENELSRIAKEIIDILEKYK